MKKQKKQKKLSEADMAKLKIKVMNSEPKGMKYGDFDSVMKGGKDMVDGFILLLSGLFRLLAFSFATAFDGMMYVFKNEKKEQEYINVTDLKVKKRG